MSLVHLFHLWGHACTRIPLPELAKAEPEGCWWRRSSHLASRRRRSSRNRVPQLGLQEQSGHVAAPRPASRVLEVLVLVAAQRTDVAAELSEGLRVALMVRFTP